MVLVVNKHIIRNIKTIIIGLCLLIVGSGVGFAQELEQLRSERQKQLDEIAFTENLLSKTALDKSSQLSKVKLLSNQIRSREKVVSNIRKELNYLDKSIADTENDIVILKDELVLLKDDYARMIYKAYQTRKSYDVAQYILAASDFNQAYKRVKYLQQYSKFRKQQAKEISEKSVDLEEQIQELANTRQQQKQLLSNRQQEVARLNNEKKDKNEYVSALGKKEKELRQELADKKRARERIEAEMQRILEEARGGKEEGSGLVLTPEMKIISNEFGSNKGRLPWPVERGVITSKFGKHRHEVMKNIEVDNKGVDITTNPSESVRSVFEGRVSNVLSIRGANLTVIIQHGEYFTVYQNLVNLNIKKGDLVQRKQKIGEVYRDKATSEMHFQLWKGNACQNPALWLAK